MIQRFSGELGVGVHDDVNVDYVLYEDYIELLNTLFTEDEMDSSYDKGYSDGEDSMTISAY